jgi:hypothetical protein
MKKLPIKKKIEPIICELITNILEKRERDEHFVSIRSIIDDDVLRININTPHITHKDIHKNFLENFEKRNSLILSDYGFDLALSNFHHKFLFKVYDNNYNATILDKDAEDFFTNKQATESVKLIYLSHFNNDIEGESVFKDLRKHFEKNLYKSNIYVAFVQDYIKDYHEITKYFEEYYEELRKEEEFEKSENPDWSNKEELEKLIFKLDLKPEGQDLINDSSSSYKFDNSSLMRDQNK